MEEPNFDDKDQFAEDILRMLYQGSFNDVRIRLSDGEIVANNYILVVRSEYFATMFSHSKFIEGETGSVDMSHCSKAVMERIIKFFFSGEISFNDLPLGELLELSRMSAPWGILKSSEPFFEMTPNHPKLIQNRYLAIALYPLVKIEAPKLTPNQTNLSRVMETDY